MKPALKQLLTLLPLLPVLILQSGCCTYSMWNEGTFDASNEPAINPHFQLFQADRKNDYLVVYKEYSERHKSVRLRAYWLIENEDRILAQQRPEFVCAHLATNLISVPVFEFPLTNGIPLPQTYAVFSATKQSFTLFSDDDAIGVHNLPIYDDGRGKIERIAMTPLAVSADVVIVAGAVAIIAGVAYAQGYDCYYH